MRLSTDIIEDFSRFRDPATQILTSEASGGAEVRIIRDGVERRYFFDASSGRIDKRGVDKKSFISFRSLLASEDFAALNSLSDTQKRLIEPKDTDNFLAPSGSISYVGSGTSKSLSFAEFLNVSLPKTSDKLSCILVDGPAGVGKTSLIERLVLERARDRGSAPVLHVTSRGRRLTNLRDALAGTISDLRAKFVPAEIPVLVRYSLLQVALDGFDEFVDPDGYKDAWAALRDFMKDCGAAGPLILAGRDTFFDQQKFEQQLSRATSSAEIINVRLTEVPPSHAKEWLKKNGWPNEQLETTETNNYLRPGSYMLRPFFLSRICHLGGWDMLKFSRQSPQTFIISSMLEREAGILQLPLEMPKEKIVYALENLFETVAEDMTDREVDSIPLNYLNFVAEVAFEGLLDKNRLLRLQHSLGSLALLEIAEDGEAVRFPHSEVQNRFLVRYLIRSFSRSIAPAFLGRIIFGLDRMEAFAERMLEIDSSQAIQVDTMIQELRSNRSQSVRFAENLAALALTSLVRDDDHFQNRTFSSLYANDVRVFGEYAVSKFEEVQIARLDVRDGDLSNVIFSNSQVSVLITNASTRFGRSVPDIGIIQFDDVSSTKTLRSLSEKSAWLSKYSSFGKIIETDGDRLLPLMRLFDRICRRFLVQTYIRNSDNDQGSYLLRGDNWEKIRSVLIDAGRFEIESRVAAGRSDDFYSVIDPAGLINPVSDNDTSTRSKVLELAKRS